MISMRGNDEEGIDALFRAYRDACPAPEPSANFMPNLWQRIEARRSFAFSFQRMASGFVTAAIALSILLGVYMWIPRSNRPYYSQSYVEALSDADALDTPDFVAPIRLDLADPGR